MSGPFQAYPSDITVSAATPRAVRLLRSRRRTFLFKLSLTWYFLYCCRTRWTWRRPRAMRYSRTGRTPGSNWQDTQVLYSTQNWDIFLFCWYYSLKVFLGKDEWWELHEGHGCKFGQLMGMESSHEPPVTTFAPFIFCLSIYYFIPYIYFIIY